MVVGLLRITLHVPEARSLKDRRAAVRSVIERVRARYNVSIAEVGELDRWQTATVAVAAVSNDRSHLNEVLDRVTNTIAGAGTALITQREMEFQTYGDREPLGGGFERLMAQGPDPLSVLDEDHEDDEDDDGDQ